jgi:mRNA interferase RelE/StbE
VSYSVLISRRDQKELTDLPLYIYPKISEAMRALSDHPRPKGCSKLTGREGWRIRVGDYRVIYEIDDKIEEINIFHIGHRKDIYR